MEEVREPMKIAHRAYKFHSEMRPHGFTFGRLSRSCDKIPRMKSSVRWLLFEYKGRELVVLSKPFKTKELAEKERLKYPDRCPAEDRNRRGSRVKRILKRGNLGSRSAQREKTKLDLVRQGLAVTDRNWSIIDNKLGAHYTVLQFREAITQDPQFKQSLQWDAEPFAEVVRNEQKRQATDQQQFVMFVGAARAATAQGVNVAPNRANYEMVRSAIDDQAQDFNIENVMAMLFRGGLELAPNALEVANALVQERDDAERDRLAEIVVDAMRSWRTQHRVSGSIVRDEYGREQALKKIKQLSLDELRAKAQVIEYNRKLASMSPSDLKAQAEQDRQEQHRSQGGALNGKPPLPETNQYGERIDSAYLVRISNTNLDLFKRLVLKHGYQNVTNRIQGRG
jgi:hypothetical protein